MVQNKWTHLSLFDSCLLAAAFSQSPNYPPLSPNFHAKSHVLPCSTTPGTLSCIYYKIFLVPFEILNLQKIPLH
ncbi:hypothetical protein L1987_18391 [Smallanthus sonchifolius]|uniref:Uncharacterized protein n=1 Tax=Smallanthus sonchifolius TaxID=185202 RepID=A0ACB9J0N5_9ASTR|nr:hypothetical protein L1987_18391 [Smallanthus sonchifolius]